MINVARIANDAYGSSDEGKGNDIKGFGYQDDMVGHIALII